MSILRHILLSLIAGGLLAASGVRAAAARGDGVAATWQDVPQGPDVPALCVRVETATAVAMPSKDCHPRVPADGDGGPDSGVHARPWSIARPAAVIGQVCATLDGQSLLVQTFRRVNGSANAHGARA